jgi:hypothetical protein
MDEELRAFLNERFDAIDQRFTGIDQRFDELRRELDKRFAGVDQRFRRDRSAGLRGSRRSPSILRLA